MPVSKTSRLALVGILFIVCAQGMVGAVTAASAAAAPQLTKVVNATKDDVSPGRTYSAPYLAVDPGNPKIIVGGFIEFRTRSCGLIRSTNGGVSWKILDSQPDLKSYPYCLANNSNIFHAPVAFGRNGTLYLATMAWDTPDSRNKEGIQIARSTDLGDHWTTVLARDARPTTGDTQENDRPITGLVVDTTHGSQDIVYVSVRRSFPNTASPSAVAQQAVMLVSHDGAKTFAPPVIINASAYAGSGSTLVNQSLSARTTIPGSTTTTAPPNTFGADPTNVANYGVASNGQGLTMDSKGDLYYGYLTGSSNVTPSVPSALVVSKSTDQGKTWTAMVAQPPSFSNRQNVRIAWDKGSTPEGTLHVVWEYSPTPTLNSYAQVDYIRSTDGGKTWSAPKRLPDSDPNMLYGSYLPEVHVAPNGRVDVVWWDTRNDPGIRSNDEYYAYSTDDGKTWSPNIRVTDQSVDRRFGVWGFNFDQNSPPGLLSTNNYAMFAWDDTRLSTGPNGNVLGVNPSDASGIGPGVQDIFTDAMQFKAIGGGTSKAAKVVFAAALGVVGVGLILTIVAFSTRKRSGGAGTTKPGTTKAPAGVS